MNFCVLSPEAGLERYSTLSKTHLVLPHVRNKRYWEFYRKQRDAGDFIILDNSAYEGKVDTKRMLKAIQFLSPQVSVLPDFLDEDWSKTFSESQDFLGKHYGQFDTEWMFVPQARAGDTLGFIEGLVRMLDDERVTWIGLPRAMCYSVLHDPMARVRMAEQIKKRSPLHKIHALGMFKGSIQELELLRGTGCVESIDSNAPVWRGWNGFLMEREWKDIPVDYSDPNLPPEDGIKDTFIKHNLEKCGVSCKHSS